jgi:hypothetical protein
MKFLPFASLLFLCSCVATGPVPVVYKVGSTGDQRKSAVLDCETQALSKVPRAMASAVTPAYTMPSNVQCYSTGYTVSCQEYGGQTIGGNAYSYDANQDLRDRVTMQCLANKGYQLVSLPTCDAEQSKRAIASAQQRMPSYDKIECVVQGGYALKQ